GIGIDAEALPRIFDMFFRATNKTTGSGLGLYIVKEAVEKLQGVIAIESSVGQGTTFKIEIPNHSTIV
ncbi:MAG TPA: HAMP domain-containing sensor histidine kinase, partial [Cyclobacteriaceae bacterium]|nr:HAMP domain-containing sensor histidine kinase [Cyclobacteriaceae bacterium]